MLPLVAHGNGVDHLVIVLVRPRKLPLLDSNQGQHQNTALKGHEPGKPRGQTPISGLFRGDLNPKQL